MTSSEQASHDEGSTSPKISVGTLKSRFESMAVQSGKAVSKTAVDLKLKGSLALSTAMAKKGGGGVATPTEENEQIQGRSPSVQAQSSTQRATPPIPPKKLAVLSRSTPSSSSDSVVQDLSDILPPSVSMDSLLRRAPPKLPTPPPQAHIESTAQPWETFEADDLVSAMPSHPVAASSPAAATSEWVSFSSEEELVALSSGNYYQPQVISSPSTAHTSSFDSASALKASVPSPQLKPTPKSPSSPSPSPVQDRLTSLLTKTTNAISSLSSPITSTDSPLRTEQPPILPPRNPPLRKNTSSYSDEPISYEEEEPTFIYPSTRTNLQKTTSILRSAGNEIQYATGRKKDPSKLYDDDLARIAQGPKREGTGVVLQSNQDLKSGLDNIEDEEEKRMAEAMFF